MENFLDKVAELQSRIADVRKENAELGRLNSLKVKEVLDGYFNPFNELSIGVSGTSASFYMEDDLGIRREVFSLYFYERYKEDPKLELSYYTTSTVSDFELLRLQNLGKVAKIVLEKSERILKEIAEVRKSDLERSNELYSIQSGYEKEIAEYNRSILSRRKLEIELLLREGIVFDQYVYIEFKRNYSIKVITMKMVDVSKSGKTCTVLYTTRDGFSTREENCNVENILNQVVYFYKNIVQELLTA